MKKFLAVYTGSPDAFEKFQQQFPDAEQRKAREKAGIDGWHQWMVTNQKSIVETGGPLGKTKRIAASGISDIRNNLAGYTTVQADSHEAAAALFQKHPHFTLFPGDAVEVMEILPIPQQ